MVESNSLQDSCMHTKLHIKILVPYFKIEWSKIIRHLRRTSNIQKEKQQMRKMNKGKNYTKNRKIIYSILRGENNTTFIKQDGTMGKKLYSLKYNKLYWSTALLRFQWLMTTKFLIYTKSKVLKGCCSLSATQKSRLPSFCDATIFTCGL